MGQYKGVVRWFNSAKGYGSLRLYSGADGCVHYSIKKDEYEALNDGEQVHCKIIQGTKGPQGD